MKKYLIVSLLCLGLLFFGSVGNYNAAFSLLVFFDPLDNNPVMQWSNLHYSPPLRRRDFSVTISTHH